MAEELKIDNDKATKEMLEKEGVILKPLPEMQLRQQK